MRPVLPIPRRTRAVIDTAVAGAAVTVLAAPPGFAHDRVLREWSLLRSLEGDPIAVAPRPPLTQRELAELARVHASTTPRPASGTTVVVAPAPAPWSEGLLARLVTWAREHAVQLVVTTTRPVLAAPEGVCVVAADAMVLAPTEARQALADAATGDLTADEVAAATSGWPGLVSTLLSSTARRSIDRRSVAAVSYPVRELVREAVLPWLPPEWVPLLEYAAVAGGLDAREAEAMGDGATAVLSAARRAALLLPQGNDSSATVVMPVLGDLLMDQLYAEPERLATLRRKIARVRHTADLMDAGLRAAFDLRDWDLCAAIIDEHGLAHTFGTSPALSELDASVMASLPPDVLRDRSTTALLAEVVGVLPPGAMPVSFPRTPAEIAHAVRFPDEARRGLERSALGMVSRRVAGDAARARRLALDAADFAGAVAHSRDPEVGGLSTWWHLQAGLSCHLCGDDLAARSFYRAGWADRYRDQLGFAATDLAAKAAVLWALRGESRGASSWLDEATSHAWSGTPWAADHVQPWIRVARRAIALDAGRWDDLRGEDVVADACAREEVWPFAAWIAVHTLLATGNPREALEMLDFVPFGRPSHSTPLDAPSRRLLALLRADAYIALGQGNAARTALEQVPSGATDASTTAGRFLLLEGQVAAARKMASAALGQTQISPRDRREFGLLLAVALVRDGDIPGATDELRRAIAGSTASEDRRLSATLPPSWRSLLLEEIPEATTLLAAGADLPPVYPDQAELVTLTDRETVILSELVRTGHIDEIAARLVVSRNTVKSQIASLYRKLGASSRLEALNAAAGLALLDRVDGSDGAPRRAS